MSLINDALKRAKQAQQEAPARSAPELQFRPVEPGHATRHAFGLWIGIGLAAVAGVVVIGALRWSHAPPANAAPQTLPAQSAVATTAQSPQVASGPTPAAAVVNGAGQHNAELRSESMAKPDSPRQPQVETIPAPATAQQQTVAGASAPAIEQRPAPIIQPDGLAPISAVATTNAPPKPAPLRLQAIMFDRTHPSAMISGKMLFIGEKLGEWNLVAIDRDSATLKDGGQTKVLTLAQ